MRLARHVAVNLIKHYHVIRFIRGRWGEKLNFNKLLLVLLCHVSEFLVIQHYWEGIVIRDEH